MQHRSVDFWSSKQPEISRRVHVISWGSTACSRYYVTLQVPVTLAHVTIVSLSPSKLTENLKAGFHKVGKVSRAPYAQTPRKASISTNYTECPELAKPVYLYLTVEACHGWVFAGSDVPRVCERCQGPLTALTKTLPQPWFLSRHCLHHGGCLLCAEEVVFTTNSRTPWLYDGVKNSKIWPGENCEKSLNLTYKT
ncbi:hypothetical protein PoMZ_00747 [Pyricularia oryzae]|uniref:Uncharacterized protein n=1 Tax=Pyricularia oryzae TaxID=318829 RepID=A0A4P7N111_PYROR|nr:hypothetical protein PoMZ_00747 [Pyricularia oryzae]